MIYNLIINSFQFLLLTIIFYDIEVFFIWISFKNNWIINILSYFEIHKIIDKFMQFQVIFSLYHEIKKSILILWIKLWIFFDMILFLVFIEFIISIKSSLSNLQLEMNSSWSFLFNSRSSHNLLQSSWKKLWFL